MCKHCAKNGPLMIAGEKLSTYVEADSAKKTWTLKFCADLEAKLMMILSRRLRSDAMKFLDPNLIAPEVMADHLIKDIGLDFDYKDDLRSIVSRGLLAQAKGTLSDVIAWEAIFKVENGKDENLFQWRVGFILNDMTSIENAKKYIMDKRAEENVVYQYRLRLAMSARGPLPIATNPAQPQYTQPPVLVAPAQPSTASQPATAFQPAPAPQPLTVDTQRAQGFMEGLDSITTSHSSLDFGSAANPITLDTDRDGGPSRYTHAHAPRVSSPLATVSPYTAADLVAQQSAVPLTRPETGFHQPIANANAPGNRQSAPSAAKPPKRRPSVTSTRTTRPPSRRRSRRFNATSLS
ncbi:hypothetical protein LCI18_006804 [Fusarium solani-melongenae]|uniref:Uncharacterized protein n=1 Tax=Fusarium solani subsp. cucurbitae TaxID=2747967 RepID=A0ACD3Z3M9_FUSSC|nr:hypothetical protein LCI18_006804 [Fusarium solani-melongenae]